MDSTVVKDVATGIDLVATAFYAVTALVSFFIGKFLPKRKKG